MNERDISTSVIIPAAGTGDRLGTDRPKALVELDGIPIIQRTVRKFLGLKGLEQIVVLLPSRVVEEEHDIIDTLQEPDPVLVGRGGDSRFQSVTHGLQKLIGNQEPEYVLIHDGARPIVTKKLIRTVYKKTIEHGAAIAAVPASSTMKQVENGIVTDTVDRNQIYLAQTPQGFRTEWFRKAAAKLTKSNRKEMTDDSMVLERAGYEVHIVDGNRKNIKITYPEDLNLAAGLIR